MWIWGKSTILVEQWKLKIQDLPVAPVVSKNKNFSLLMQTSNGPDEDVRRRAVGLFKSNMTSSSGDRKADSDQAKVWEKSIYVKNDMKIDKTYKLKVRQKVFELKKNQASSSKDVLET